MKLISRVFMKSVIVYRTVCTLYISDCEFCVKLSTVNCLPFKQTRKGQIMKLMLSIRYAEC